MLAGLLGTSCRLIADRESSLGNTSKAAEYQEMMYSYQAFTLQSLREEVAAGELPRDVTFIKTIMLTSNAVSDP